MKLPTRPRLLILAAAVAVVSVGVWLDRRDKIEIPVPEGRVVIDEAFLHRLETEDQVTTRDPAIKALKSLRSARGFPTDREALRSGKTMLDIHLLDRDSLRVVIQSPVGAGHMLMQFTFVRHRRTRWELFSPQWWRREFLYRAYWDETGFKAASG